jgi:hypothetical protein
MTDCCAGSSPVGHRPHRATETIGSGPLLGPLLLPAQMISTTVATVIVAVSRFSVLRGRTSTLAKVRARSAQVAIVVVRHTAENKKRLRVSSAPD